MSSTTEKIMEMVRDKGFRRLPSRTQKSMLAICVLGIFVDALCEYAKENKAPHRPLQNKPEPKTPAKNV